jgi:hypothetical protein
LPSGKLRFLEYDSTVKVQYLRYARFLRISRTAEVLIHGGRPRNTRQGVKKGPASSFKNNLLQQKIYIYLRKISISNNF